MSASRPIRLLLASRSEARRRMLEAAGVPFDTVDSRLDEATAKAGLREAGFAPRDLAEMLARLKASEAGNHPGALVLGADQVLETAAGVALDKPASREEARAQLLELRNHSHWLHSAAAIVEGGELVWSVTESAELTMRPFGDAFLEDYLEREYDDVRSNVGAYRIEGMGAQLFESVEGSHFAILGLPLLPLLEYLRERRILPA